MQEWCWVLVLVPALAVGSQERLQHGEQPLGEGPREQVPHQKQRHQSVTILYLFQWLPSFLPSALYVLQHLKRHY